MLRTLINIFTILILGLFFLIIGFVYYLENKEVIPPQNKVSIIENISNAKTLPKDFYDIYNKQYPNAISVGTLNAMFKHFVLGEINNRPSYILTYNFGITSTFDRYCLAFQLDEEVTQKECINYLIDKSQLLINKDPYQLTRKEITQIILQLENSALYKPNKSYPEYEKSIYKLLE